MLAASFEREGLSAKLTKFTHLADCETERGILELLVDNERVKVHFRERGRRRRKLERKADSRTLLLGIEGRKCRLLRQTPNA